ncbi:MAG: hypothetical protein K8R31_06340 [Bacteroidales bacterium]|nr:hypothetical protein [Bacteroidales bacterium]
MKILKYSLVLLLIINFSCRKEIDNPINDWFQDPPVSPITQTIKTVIPIGYAASLVSMDIRGLKSPVVKSEKQKNATLLYIDTNTDYPYKFKGDTYGQMIVAYISAEENTALVSIFFTDMDIVTGSFTLLNVVAFPVIYDEFEDKTTAVYVSMDVNLGSNLDIGLDLTSSEIEESLLKLENERTEINEVAIAQNAWIIDIYHQGTYDDLYDDKFKIYGGQQAVAVENYETESSAGVLQMAMINTEFSSDCLKNPTSGYVFMQDVEVATSTNNSDIVFGHVFYEFTPDCDGRVLVDIATGNFIFAIGKEIDLGLN